MVFVFNIFFNGMIASQGFALSLVSWIFFRRHPLRYVLTTLGISFIAYSITPLAAHLGAITLLQSSMYLESLIPIGFWFAAETLFEDDFSWEYIHLLGAVAGIVSFVNVYPMNILGNEIIGRSTTLMELLKTLHLTAIIFGIRSAVKGWKHELVPARIKLRIVALVGSGLVLLILILKKYYLVEERLLDIKAPLLISPIVFIVLLGSNYFLIRNFDWLNPEKTVRKSPTINFSDVAPEELKSESKDTDLARKIDDLMANQLVFKDEDLTIASLALKLKTPEYKLRSYINSTLQYRNFNQFLARYRIELAKTLLVDPKYHDEKILSIAFEVGFGSLAPFNKTFKLLTGMTPTEFKQQSIAERV